MKVCHRITSMDAAWLVEKNIQVIVDWAMTWSLEDDMALMVDRLIED